MRRSDDLLLTAEELRLRRIRRRRLAIGAISLVLLFVGGIFAARPARHAIKSWQARRHAENAFNLIASEKWNEAQKEATAAYQLSPNEPEAIRAVARFLSRVGQPQAFEFWDRLTERQSLTRDDLRDEAAIAIALGEAERATAAVGKLMAKGNHATTPGDWLLAAQLAAQRGAPNESTEALRHVFTDRTADAREKLQAALLELRVSTTGLETDPTNQAEAWRWIEKLAEAKDAVSLDALVLLAQRALSPGGTTSVSSLSTNTDRTEPVPPISIANAIERHPLAKTPQNLIATDLRIHAAPNEKEALMQSAIDHWKDADIKSLVALATWLNSHREYQRELDIIPPARAVQDRDLFLQRLDALGGLGRWQEIKQALNSESFPLDPMISNMYLARCNAQLEEKTAAENNWQRAFEACAGDAGKLMKLADYAEKNGATAIAASAYDTAIESAPKLRAAWQGKLRLVQADRNTGKIHAILAEMLKIWPNDSAIQNDEAYTRLLLLPNDSSSSASSESSSPFDESRTVNREPATRSTQSALRNQNSEIAELESRARDLVKREPASLPHRTLLALVYLKQNRPATALGVYENLHVPPNAASPSAMAVHAAVLAANGNASDAAKEATQASRDVLLPEESALLNGL